MSDGNIVLQVTNGTRVHKSILRANSEVFRDIFNAADALREELIDGLPVVKLHDAVEDWEVVLGSLYQLFHMNPFLNDLTFPQLKPMLQLGRNYQFDGMLKASLK
ncbi:hypothetical protein D9619_012704 [Psilocybe cf. subviscida]|uniref:BTB domain-containing protein n=1 Tax=Psilocybe cf. subviscida TaxID=2480587 RepID=A0A8H5AR06_9AGAR|nr:hypothetical protein D9619_012704 [Psilocybe cf. subviscida]